MLEILHVVIHLLPPYKVYMHVLKFLFGNRRNSECEFTVSCTRRLRDFRRQFSSSDIIQTSVASMSTKLFDSAIFVQ